MAKELTLDSSVFVSAFVKDDLFRLAALQIFKKIFSGEYHVSTSAIVPVEVCGVISRRVGVDKAVKVKNQLDKWEDMNFISYVEVDAERRREAADLAVKLQLRGMDALVVQAAKEKKAVLATFDEEMAEKSKKIVKVFTFTDFKK